MNPVHIEVRQHHFLFCWSLPLQCFFFFVFCCYCFPFLMFLHWCSVHMYDVFSIARGKRWKHAIFLYLSNSILYINYIQLGGMIKPWVVPFTFWQKDSAGWSWYMSFISCNPIPLHGELELQSNFIATLVADVPLIFWNVTWLIFTPEVCRTSKRYSHQCNDYIVFHRFILFNYSSLVSPDQDNLPCEGSNFGQ